MQPQLFCYNRPKADHLALRLFLAWLSSTSVSLYTGLFQQSADVAEESIPGSGLAQE